MSKKNKKKIYEHPQHDSFEIKPRNEKQKKYIRSIRTKEVTVAIGCAGSGKTLIPVCLAAEDINRNKVDQIILTKPNIGAGAELGFLPGTQDQKLAAWLAEPLAILEKIFGQNELECKLKNKSILLVPFEKMRGRTFDYSYVIVDEAQNLTESQMELLTTRIGEESRVIINGDHHQTDLPKNMKTGLHALIDIVQNYKMDVPIIEFTEEDVERSGICRSFVINWSKYKKND